MDTARIAELLRPFLRGPISQASSGALPLPADCSSEGSGALAQLRLDHISQYIDLLLRWNARVNLTAVRDPEEIVTRHFGESLFAARHLFPQQGAASSEYLIDLGSGAGFPGLPMKVWRPNLRLTLIEATQKKCTFLQEAVRKLGLANVEVFSGRGEDYVGQADVVTLRAVERFERALPLALRLVRSGGRISLLIGDAQTAKARELSPGVAWRNPIEVPLSSRRVLLIGKTG
jgi:16S rRNA (guanine527-N7)-methyltransferase